ncbi:MAG: hypothetical protein EOO11_03190 [Chitinophagaceae bacterium]|nr:MAG: hypothetical protein EOO11_03190 [Chitinophagaceae bacterium]
MKKVLLAFDGTNFPEAALEFLRHLHQLSPLMLTGVFAPLVSISGTWSYASAGTGGPVIPLSEEDEADDLKQNIARFEAACAAAGIPYRVHRAYFDLALPTLRKESRFADLLVLSSGSFYNGTLFTAPFLYLREAMHDAECPVLVLPDNSTLPRRNIIAYDGSAASVFAMKQFAYILPELAANETVVAYASTDPDAPLPESALVEELVAQHYRCNTLRKIGIGTRRLFEDWVGGFRDAVLVTGSFGRNALSELFHESASADVIRAHQLPVFIAHR